MKITRLQVIENYEIMADAKQTAIVVDLDGGGQKYIRFPGPPYMSADLYRYLEELAKELKAQP